jgi:hypothetical protein
VRLKRRARRLVRRQGRVRVRVVAVVEDAAGNALILRKKLTLRTQERRGHDAVDSPSVSE